MISFYQRSPSRQSIQKKPDELSFLSDDEQEEIGFKHNKIRRDSNLTNADSAYYSEESINILNKKDIQTPNQSPNQSSNIHQNVLMWQKQQQHYQQQQSPEIINSPRKSSIISSQTRIPTPESSPITEPINDYWENFSDNGSIKSTSTTINKMKYLSRDIKLNNPEQRAERIQLRMNQWKKKLEHMNSQIVYNNGSEIGGITQFNKRNSIIRNRSKSLSQSNIDSESPEPFSSSQSVYSMNSSGILDEKYDSFADDRNTNGVFSLHQRSIAQIPRPHSSLDFRHNQSNFSNPFQKEAKMQALQQELENSKLIYNQKIQQLNQMKIDLEQYQFKMEEVRELEIENARHQAIEELEQTTVKNLKLEIEALQCKLEETMKELEHSKTYADMLRNEVLILKMNEQNLSFENVKDEEFDGETDNTASDSVNELTLLENYSNQGENEIKAKAKIIVNEENEEKIKSLENVVKQKDNEIQELKKQLERMSRSNELSKKEIILLNKKVENHKQAREDIERRHTNLVDVASANEIELNKLRYKIEQMNHNHNNNNNTNNNNKIVNSKNENKNLIPSNNSKSSSNVENKFSKNKVEIPKKIISNNSSINEISKNIEIINNKNEIEIENINQEKENSSIQNKNNTIINKNEMIIDNNNVEKKLNESIEQEENNNSIQDQNNNNSNIDSDSDEDINDILNELSLSDLEFDNDDYDIEMLNSDQFEILNDLESNSEIEDI